MNVRSRMINGVRVTSWSSNSSEELSRTTPTSQQLGGYYSPETEEPPALGPTTYIVAPNANVLAQLIYDNQDTLPPAWAYRAQAQPSNTYTEQRGVECLEDKLLKQKKESEEDSRWLAREEAGMMGKLSTSSSLASNVSINFPLNSKADEQMCNDKDSDSAVYAVLMKSHSKANSEGTKVAEASAILQPTALLNRDDDKVYEFMTAIVHSVKQLLVGVKEQRVASFIELVTAVGLALRDMLSAVDELVPTWPTRCHREIEIAHRVLSKDMASLINAMKAAQRYYRTTVEEEYRKAMLEASHILVVDAKNLLDAVDSIRVRLTDGSQR
ncbi:Focal adhesion kinase 1 [Halotydeus destructor]|nr:Focal adhesion kinase 1 [Halotydeus destructor]